MEQKIGKLRERFKEYRLTPQRRLVLEIFMENKERHLSAEEVYSISRDKKQEIGLATIYRTLDLLEELNLLHRLYFGDGRSRYELVQGKANKHPHHHLICLNCEEILEVEEDLLHQLVDVIKEKYQFDIIDHNIQFFGYCRNCKKQGQEAEAGNRGPEGRSQRPGTVTKGKERKEV
jgi:Fur family ferric uptake transcriptional regulator